MILGKCGRKCSQCAFEPASCQESDTNAWIEDAILYNMSLDDAKGVLPVIFVPRRRGYTAHARAVPPTTVPLTDAVFDVARTALLVRALTGAPELLSEATNDRLPGLPSRGYTGDNKTRLRSCASTVSQRPLVDWVRASQMNSI